MGPLYAILVAKVGQIMLYSRRAKVDEKRQQLVELVLALRYN